MQCFGRLTCYPLAFGLLASFMILGAVSVVLGKKWYRVKQAQGSVYTNVVGSIFVRNIPFPN